MPSRAKRFLAGLAVAAGLAGPAGAGEAFRMGVGVMPCTYWLATPASEGEGADWTLGYWSGLNAANPANHFVGAQADGDIMLRRVKRRCRENPDWTLAQTVDDVYRRLVEDSGGRTKRK